MNSCSKNEQNLKNMKIYSANIKTKKKIIYSIFLYTFFLIFIFFQISQNDFIIVLSCFLIFLFRFLEFGFALFANSCFKYFDYASLVFSMLKVREIVFVFHLEILCWIKKFNGLKKIKTPMNQKILSKNIKKTEKFEKLFRKF